ncbi:hypothetical protein [Actinomadura decatromicini]|uniref:Uncharacterized protein n=1 Tax=Actinomadura decatromicini TaxID=2604572 RepID=A0A5D3FRZ0_9ACTN|nr:hypothetical protein [Actinomadura decatromicini]TYK50879.1 hypothetical protein FXF68_10465 [Actinomadura decatromicini]
MAASLSEIEMRLRAVEARVGRHDEDMAALVDTGSQTLTLVKALAQHAGLDVDVLLAQAEEDAEY